MTHQREKLRFSTNETNVGRREFIKTAGLGAIALGAGFGASRAIAQEASSSTYKPGDFLVGRRASRR